MTLCLDVYEQHIKIVFPPHISLILIHYQSNYLFADMWQCCAFFPPEQPSLQSGSPLCVLSPLDDKIAALSQAIAYEAEGHLRNDGANMTDISDVENCWRLINGSSVWYSFGLCVCVCFLSYKGHTVLRSQPGWSWDVVGSTAG